MATRSGQHRHEFDRRTEEPLEPVRCLVDGQPRTEMLLLGGDANRTVVGIARTHAETTDCLKSCIRYRNAVCTQGEGLHEVSWRAESSGDDQCDIGRFG